MTNTTATAIDDVRQVDHIPTHIAQELAAGRGVGHAGDDAHGAVYVRLSGPAGTDGALVQAPEGASAVRVLTRAIETLTGLRDDLRAAGEEWDEPID